MSSLEQGGEEKFKIGGLGKNKILMVVAVILIAIGAGIYSHWFTSDAYVREGNELALKGKSAEAEKAYTKAIERDSQNVNAYLGRARVREKKIDEWKQNIDDYNKVIELSPQNWEAYIGRAHIYCIYPVSQGKYDQTKYKDAIEDCNKAIEINPKAWIAYYVRAEAYRHLKDYKNAMADCEQALKIEPQSARAYEEIAQIYENQTLYKDAITYYTKAIERASTKQYQDKLAFQEYASLIANEGKKSILEWLYHYRGVCHALLGERDAALKDANRGGILAVYSCGEICYEEKKYLDAIFYFTKCIEYGKDEKKEQADASFVNKIFNSGKKNYYHVVMESSYALLSKAYYAQGNIYYHESNYVGAIENYTKAIESSPQNQDAYHNRACCYDAQGEYAQAVADYTKAIELKPDYALAYSNRGRTHQRLGNMAQAEADFAKANELEGK